LNYENYLRFKNLASELKLSFKEYRHALKLFNQIVREKKGNYCGVCSSTYKVTVHHLFFKGFYPRLSLNPENGIPLCLICHSQVHGKMLMVSEDKKIKIKAMVLGELDDN